VKSKKTLRHLVFTGAFFLFLAHLFPLFADQLVPKGYTVGTPWEGPMATSRTSSQIMARDRQLHGQHRAQHSKPLLRPDFQNLPANPLSPDTTSWPPGSNGPPRRPFTPQTVGVNFTGATLADTEQSFPPDSMGAAGLSQFVVAVNGRIRSFNKSTGLVDGGIDANTDVFFEPVMNPGLTNNFTSDPRIRFDRISNRWFVSMIDVPGFTGSLPNHILIAVSDGPTITPSTVWNLFAFGQDLVSPTGDTGKFADYDTLGIDVNALYVGVNIFGTRRGGTFSGTTVFVIRKSSVMGPGPIVVTAFRNLAAKSHGVFTGPYTPQGVVNFDPAATEGYVIGVDSGVYGLLQLRRISNPGGTPAISSDIPITIPLNGATITVPHLGNTAGTAGNLDGADYRLMCAQLRNGSLWTCSNIAVDNTGSPSGTDTRMGVRWYELTGIASGLTPSVVQSGTLYQPSAANTTDQRHYWMGSVMVSGQGHAALGFSVAGANEYINAGTVGRLANDPPGTMRTPALYTAGSTSYNPAGDTGSASGRRWGDFSYTCLDPSDDMTMWTIQEFCNDTDSYGVQVSRLLAPRPATPTSCSPSSLPNGGSNLSVVLTGVSDGDTGFFDPGAGYSNRLSAAIGGGGVTVNSIAYTDPTHVTLNLTVANGAAGGARIVTITNPDGQSVSSSGGILTISPPLNIQSIKVTNSVVTLSWNSISGKTYRVEYKDNLGQSFWSNVTPDITATGSVTSDSIPTGARPGQFYRVQQLP
jgi:hypothetical protein